MSSLDRVADIYLAVGKGIYSVGQDLVFGVERTLEGLGAGQVGRAAEIS